MSGGYFTYICKNFYTYNCNNQVWVQGTACAECVAAGRDSVEDGEGSFDRSVNVALLPYTEASSGPQPYWTYPCKNFNRYNCNNQVWQQGTTCAECVAAQRESVDCDSGDATNAAVCHDAARSFVGTASTNTGVESHTFNLRNLGHPALNI